MIKSLVKIIVAVLLFLFVGTGIHAQTEATKILFIGNSYTHMNNMPSMFDKFAQAEGRNVLVQKSTHSGYCFREHAEREDMYEDINSQKWDYVVLQGYSREFSHTPEYIDSATVPYLRQITDSIYTNNPCTNVLLYMTWGYEDGFPEREEIDTYEEMADSIERGYSYASELFRIPVVPVGMVWKQVKENTEIDLYAKDRAHPSMSGSFLIANTFFNAIFHSVALDEDIKVIEPETAAEIKQYTSQVIEELRAKYHLDGNQFKTIDYTTEKGKYLLEYTSMFPMANVIEWDFGDGESSIIPDGVHKYRKHGTYTVKLRIVDGCGERTFEQRIEYKKYKKQRKRCKKD
ncbi:MAG: PKD domain-containing protein [Crocinitomicaceae bacterium]|nr:PKD domain-containing protein [Crocinitomicaceae bacterium]